MKKCGEACHPVCDFCKHYDRYVDEDLEITGEGNCLITNEDVQFSWYCEDFHCFRLKD